MRVGHWIFENRVSLVGMQSGLASRSSGRPRAALELTVKDLGADPGNVGLEYAHFSSDLNKEKNKRIFVLNIYYNSQLLPLANHTCSMKVKEKIVFGIEVAH